MNAMHGNSNVFTFSSMGQFLAKPYVDGWHHFKEAFTAEHPVFQEARNNLQGNTFPEKTIPQRVRNFGAGVILWIPIVNMVAKLAMDILFPSNPNFYSKPPVWQRIDHIVVLMLENRSFDNMLGKLYPKSAQFNGLDGQEENSYLDRAGIKHTIKVWDSQGVRMDTPNPDPGEEFDDITYQLFETRQPALAAIPTMGGFAQNYYDFICRDQTAQEELRKKRGLENVEDGFIEPTEVEIADIMHCYSPSEVPVISQLASNFAVSDMYHASAPNQTWPNRFFAHTGTAGGFENNMPMHFPYTMKTIFTRFNDLNRDHGWKIYYHDMPQSVTLSNLWPYPQSFKPFDEFVEDASIGRLPSYSFIEPRYYQECQFPSDQHPPHDVRHGEQLIADVYNALRKSPQWKKSLLVITYDEHGGCFDHQAPPSAPPPEPPKANQKFHFDRYGVRVPAVFVSPHIAPQTVLRPPVDSKAPVFDHTSIIASVRNCFSLGGSLTERDAVAPDFSSVLNMTEGEYNMGPAEIIAPPAPKTNIQEAEGRSMNGLQAALLHVSAHLPENSALPEGENYFINAVRKINQLSKNTLQGLEEILARGRSGDLLAGRRQAMANFANFCQNQG